MQVLLILLFLMALVVSKLKTRKFTYGSNKPEGRVSFALVFFFSLVFVMLCYVGLIIFLAVHYVFP